VPALPVGSRTHHVGYVDEQPVTVPVTAAAVTRVLRLGGLPQLVVELGEPLQGIDDPDRVAETAVGGELTRAGELEDLTDRRAPLGSASAYGRAARNTGAAATGTSSLLRVLPASSRVSVRPPGVSRPLFR
jgi:hypothetical protein